MVDVVSFDGGVFLLKSPVARKMLDELSNSGMLWETISIIFEEWAIAKEANDRPFSATEGERLLELMKILDQKIDRLSINGGSLPQTAVASPNLNTGGSSTTSLSVNKGYVPTGKEIRDKVESSISSKQRTSGLLSRAKGMRP